MTYLRLQYILRFGVIMGTTHRKYAGGPTPVKLTLASGLLILPQRIWGYRTKPKVSRHHHPCSIHFSALSFAVVFLISFLTANCGSTSPLQKELGYSDDTIVLIVNADDVGLHADETDATIQAMNQGMVTSGSIMVPCRDFDRTINIWKKNPDLDFGIHLTLTCEWGHLYSWAPILPKDIVPSLYTHDGLMWPNIESLVQHARVNEVLLEAEAQIRRVLASGVRPTHLDGHMDWYTANTDYFEGVMRLAQKYRLPMRVWQWKRTKLPWWPNNPAKMRREGYVFPDDQTGYYNLERENERNGLRQDKYSQFLNSLHPGVHELTIHLAFRTPEIERFMGPEDVARRTRDYDIWTGEATRAIIQSRKIFLVGFRNLQKLQDNRWPQSQQRPIIYGCFLRLVGHPWN